MTDVQCALYARVSSESQARDNTIASQVAALRERIVADGFLLEPDHSYEDEGYSGSILSRPALERLRDAVAGGRIERIYVHAPDRLARRYAHQVLLIDEFRRAGAEVVFLNRPIGGTAEDDLLLQVQGVIAEYERAKILERTRYARCDRPQRSVHFAGCGGNMAASGLGSAVHSRSGLCRDRQRICRLHAHRRAVRFFRLRTHLGPHPGHAGRRFFCRSVSIQRARRDFRGICDRGTLHGELAGSMAGSTVSPDRTWKQTAREGSSPGN